jgi:hypothetical protein
MGKLRVVGINVDHFHMGDLLRMAYYHGDVQQIVDTAVKSLAVNGPVLLVQ